MARLSVSRPATAGGLNLSSDERERAGKLLVALLDEYERSIPAPRIVPELDHQVLASLAGEPFAAAGIGVERLFREITDKVLPNSTAIAHPRLLAYVQGPPNGIAPYAEAIAAAINQNCNFWQLSPAASVIERSVIGWLAGLFGFGADSGGLLTSGGSMANLIALTAAINQRRPGLREHGLQDGRPPLVVYTSAQAHRCIEKAAVILGLGLHNLRLIPVDDRYRMRADLLREAIAADRASGAEPFCVVATAGTVNTGAVDPIEAIADVCRENQLWLHVDGAYGGLFILGDRSADALRPCGLADSIALDPHKLLFASLEAGCLIVRDRHKLRRAFAFNSSYLTTADDDLMIDFMDYGPQLSRDFKALKIWSALKVFGVDAFRAAINQCLDLTQRLASHINAQPALHLMAPVTTTAACFTIDGFDETTYRQTLSQLAEDGTALLGPVVLAGRHGIRACITNYRTTAADIDLIVDRLAQLAATR